MLGSARAQRCLVCKYCVDIRHVLIKSGSCGAITRRRMSQKKHACQTDNTSRGPAARAPPRARARCPLTVVALCVFFWLLLLRWLGFGFCHGFWFCVFDSNLTLAACFFRSSPACGSSHSDFQKTSKRHLKLLQVQLERVEACPRQKPSESHTYTTHPTSTTGMNEYSESECINSERGANTLPGRTDLSQFSSDRRLQ